MPVCQFEKCVECVTALARNSGESVIDATDKGNIYTSFLWQRSEIPIASPISFALQEKNWRNVNFARRWIHLVREQVCPLA